MLFVKGDQCPQSSSKSVRTGGAVGSVPSTNGTISNGKIVPSLFVPLRA